MFVCPSCQSSLRSFSTSKGDGYHCAACHGMAMNLLSMNREYAPRRTRDMIQTLLDRGRIPGRQGKLSCPHCAEKMTVVSMPGPPPVEVDVCTRCKIAWFDPSEFERLQSTAVELPSLPRPRSETLSVSGLPSLSAALPPPPSAAGTSRLGGQPLPPKFAPQQPIQPQRAIPQQQRPQQQARPSQQPPVAAPKVAFPPVRGAAQPPPITNVRRATGSQYATQGQKAQAARDAAPQPPPPPMSYASAQPASDLLHLQDEDDFDRLPAQPPAKLPAPPALPDSGNPTFWQYIPGLLGIPVKLDSPSLANRPVTTWGLAILMTVMYLCLWVTGTLEAAVNQWGFIPSQWGRHGGLTIITSFLLHGGLFHVLGNMYFMVVFGENVEDHLGPGKLVMLLLGAHIGGLMLHAMFDPRADIPVVGASAGISGLLAFYAITFPMARIGLFTGWLFYFGWLRLPAIVALVLFIILQLFIMDQQISGKSDVSGLAHLGGLVVGAIAAIAARYLYNRPVVLNPKVAA